MFQVLSFDFVHQAVTVVSKCLLLVAQELETMSIRKSRFLQEEHSRMEQEVVALRRVDQLRRKLESARRESQDRSAEVTGAQEEERHAVERATTAE